VSPSDARAHGVSIALRFDSMAREPEPAREAALANVEELKPQALVNCLVAPAQGRAWTLGTSLATGQVWRVPIAAAYPFSAWNSDGSYAVHFGGWGAGIDDTAAHRQAMLSAVAAEYVATAGSGSIPIVALSPDQIPNTSETVTYLLTCLAERGVEARLCAALGPLSIPVVIGTTLNLPTSPQAIAADLSYAGALERVLLDLLAVAHGGPEAQDPFGTCSNLTPARTSIEMGATALRSGPNFDLVLAPDRLAAQLFEHGIDPIACSTTPPDIGSVVSFESRRVLLRRTA
jgi:hypothetical protein